MASERRSLDNSRVLVTGGSGFIGTNLIESLRPRVTSLLNLDVVEPRNGGHIDVWKRCDIRDERSLIDAVAAYRPDIVVHLGARTDLHGTSRDDYAANIGGVENVVRAVGRAGSVQLAVYASSRLVFDIHHRPSDEFDYHPTTAYGESKAEGERIVRDRAGEASPWLMVRPTSIWGPWFGVPYRDFFDAVLRGRYVHPAGRRIRKSYGYVGNSVFQLERLIDAPPADVDGGVFWLADYPPIEVAAWAGEIRRCAGLGPVRSVPTWVLQAGGRAGDLLARLGMSDPPLTSFRVDNLLTEMVYDSGSTQRIAGELPFTMADGVRATVEWLRSTSGASVAGGR